MYMTKYSPFLKFKAGEIKALINLSDEERGEIIPLLELPRDSTYNESLLVKKIDDYVKKFKKITKTFSFFIDNYEVSDEIKIKGKDNYHFLLESFADYNIIPIIGLDRTDEHNSIGISFANKSSFRRIGIRITQEYFASFPAYYDELDILLKKIDLDVNCTIMLDCNYIDDLNVIALENSIVNVIKYVHKKKPGCIILVAGSSIPIPTNPQSLVKVDTNAMIVRNEIILYRNLIRKLPKVQFHFGDYTVVSPGFMEIDIDPKIIFSRMTSKIIYSLLDTHYFTRGRSIKLHGLEQYFKQAQDIIKQPFFRGKNYSWGDGYLYEKATNKGTNITPATIIAPTVNAHIKFMIEEINKGSI